MTQRTRVTLVREVVGTWGGSTERSITRLRRRGSSPLAVTEKRSSRVETREHGSAAEPPAPRGLPEVGRRSVDILGTTIGPEGLRELREDYCDVAIRTA